MAKKREKKISSSSSRILIDDAQISADLKFRIEESYKTIRANIMFSVVKKGCKVIVVSSSLPSEGKTTTTVNLAATISQADQRVLLIDADLRKPKIHQYFSLPNAPGLTNYLSDTISGKHKTDIFGIMHPTKYENLSLICAGNIPPNPAELLGSDFMKEFLNSVSKDFDYILSILRRLMSFPMLFRLSASPTVLFLWFVTTKPHILSFKRRFLPLNLLTQRF